MVAIKKLTGQTLFVVLQTIVPVTKGVLSMQPVSDDYRPLAAQYAAKDVSGAAGASGVGGNIDCVLPLLCSKHPSTIWCCW